GLPPRTVLLSSDLLTCDPIELDQIPIDLWVGHCSYLWIASATQCVKIVNESTIYSLMRTIPSRTLQFHPADQVTEPPDEELRLHLGRTRHPHERARGSIFPQARLPRRSTERF